MTIKDCIYNLPTLPIIMTNSIFTLSFVSVAKFVTTIPAITYNPSTTTVPLFSTFVLFVHIVAVLFVSWHWSARCPFSCSCSWTCLGVAPLGLGCLPTALSASWSRSRTVAPPRRALWATCALRHLTRDPGTLTV